MKHQTSSLQLCGQPTVLTLTQSTTRFSGSCRSVCTAARFVTSTSWSRAWSKSGNISTGGHRWSGQAVSFTSSSLRSSTRWTLWTQTLGVLTSCHSHGRTLDSQSRVCLQWTLMLLSDLTKLAVAVADVDQFYWNLVTCLPLNVSTLA